MANSRVMLFGFVAAGGLALLLASKRASAAAPATPPPEPEPPQLPPGRSPTTDEGQPLPFERTEHPTASRYTDELPDAPATPVGPIPTAAPPEPSLPAPQPLPSSPSSPSSPSNPIVLQPIVVTAEPSTPAPASSSKLPSKRPFGDQPLNVEASASNYGAAPAKPAATPTAPAVRSPKKAAEELLAYVTPILKQKRGSELGTKNAPNAFVKAAQSDMGVASDGIYGPATRTRAKQLGVNLPARV